VSGFLEGIVSVIIFSVGQPVYLALAVPVLVVTMLSTMIFIRLNRALSQLSEEHTRTVKNYVRACTTNSSALLGYHRF
jgi:hypothetical protein